MKLQLALDDLTLEESLELIEKVKDYIDIIEVGTPFIYREGMHVVKIMKERFPEKEILADMKIMDAGRFESASAFAAGADYVTVLAVTDLITIKECVALAEEYGKEIVVDMICVTDIRKRVEELEKLGVHGLAVHTGTDQQAAGKKPIDDLIMMSSCRKHAKISVAGGIKAETVLQYAALQPEVLIVGNGICHVKDPRDAAKRIKEIMYKYESLYGGRI